MSCNYFYTDGFCSAFPDVVRNTGDNRKVRRIRRGNYRIVNRVEVWADDGIMLSILPSLLSFSSHLFVQHGRMVLNIHGTCHSMASPVYAVY